MPPVVVTPTSNTRFALVPTVWDQEIDDRADVPVADEEVPLLPCPSVTLQELRPSMEH